MKDMKNVKSYKDFLNENEQIDEIEQKVSDNLDKHESENDSDEQITNIKDNVDKHIDNMNKEKDIIEAKKKLLTNQTLNIHNDEEQQAAEKGLDDLEKDVEQFDKNRKDLEQQKSDIEEVDKNQN